jgi:hypothetical protein
LDKIYKIGAVGHIVPAAEQEIILLEIPLGDTAY